MGLYVHGALTPIQASCSGRRVVARITQPRTSMPASALFTCTRGGCDDRAEEGHREVGYGKSMIGGGSTLGEAKGGSPVRGAFNA